MSVAALSLPELSRRVLDPRYGIFRGLGETPRARTGGEIFIMGGELVDPRYFLRLGRRKNSGSTQVAGAGLTREEALWCTLGEGIERYSAQIPREKRVGALAALGDVAIDPRDFLLYSDEQYSSPDFPYKPFQSDAIYTWVDAKNIRSGRRCLVPMQMAALGGDLHEGEPLLCQPISTGIASHSRWESALLTGLLEVIERDAFMATWLLRRPPPTIAIEPALLGALDARVAALLSRSDVQARLYLLSTDNGVPVVACKISRAVPPAIVVGAAARLSLRDAITKAVVEAYHTWAWGLGLERKPPVAVDDICDFEHHVRHYFEPESQGAASFLDDGDVVQYQDLLGPGPRSLDALVCTLNELGHDVFSVDLTSPDIADLGFVVCRAMVSGMQPLACGVRNCPLDDRRLKVVAADWRLPFPRALNLDPHPFP